MNALDRSGASAGSTQNSIELPRIYYYDPLRSTSPQEPESSVREAKTLGFAAVLIPPPWTPGSDGNRFGPSDLDRFHPLLGDGFIDRFVGACRVHGLQGDARYPAGRCC